MDKPIEKLRDSFNELANEYRISHRWRRHFIKLFNELDDSNKSWTREDEMKWTNEEESILAEQEKNNFGDN